MNKAIILALFIVAIFAATPLDIIREAAQDNSCATKTLELIKPEIDAKLAELKEVLFYLFRTKKVLNFKLKSLLLWKREDKCWTSAKSPNPNQLLVMPLKLQELLSCWPATASRMPELNSFLLTLLFKPQLTGPMMSLLPFSDTFSADKELRIVSNSTTSSSDRIESISLILPINPTNFDYKKLIDLILVSCVNKKKKPEEKN
jgi:hypothetical protein